MPLPHVMGQRRGGTWQWGPACTFGGRVVRSSGVLGPVCRRSRQVMVALSTKNAGFIFSTVRNYHRVIRPVYLPTTSSSLRHYLSILMRNFLRIRGQLPGLPMTVDFTFPKPTSCRRKVVNSLPGFPTFEKKITLKPCLGRRFNVPIFVGGSNGLFTCNRTLTNALPRMGGHLGRTNDDGMCGGLLKVALNAKFNTKIIVSGQLLAKSGNYNNSI